MSIPFRRQLAGGVKALLNALYGRTPGSGVRVLEYHYIDDTGSPLSVSRADLRTHLHALRDGGWHALTPAEYLARLANPPSISAKEVFITFDDGHESFARVAAPLLLEFGFTATVFVVTDLVGRTAEWFDRDRERIERLLASFAFTRRERAALTNSHDRFAKGKLSSVDELASLRDRGFGIESHSSRHRFSTELPPQELLEDLVDSRTWLRDKLGIDGRLLCYPYGDWNDRVARAADAAGYHAAMLSEFTTGTRNQFALGRIPLGGHGSISALRFGLSRAADVLAGVRQKKSVSPPKLVAFPDDLAITEPTHGTNGPALEPRQR